MLVLAAAFGLFTWQTAGGDLAGIGAAVAFVVALLAELYLLQARPDRLWYDGRAVAESAKTLTWRYLVGGSPFGREEVNEREADKLLLDRFRQITGNLGGAHLVPITGAAEQISPAMRRYRSLPLEERRELYRNERIGGQQSWYARTARWNERRATQWSLVLTTLEAMGLAGACSRRPACSGSTCSGWPARWSPAAPPGSRPSSTRPWPPRTRSPARSCR